MRVLDQRKVSYECFVHDRMLKDLCEMEKKHEEKVLRNIENEQKRIENRLYVLNRHEDENQLKAEARFKDYEKHHHFLISSLRII